MSITLRQYNTANDFFAVSDFLTANYLKENHDGNFLQPAWEYMHSHPDTDEKSFGRIGIWEDNGEIAGIAHFEMLLGEAFFEIRPGYEYLKPEMLDYAEANLYRETSEGNRYLDLFINDFDTGFESLVQSRGYQINYEYARPMSILKISRSFRQDTTLPDGFKITSLDTENNLAKLERVVWRGFDHGCEPPEVDCTGRVKLQSAPNFRKDLNIIIISPDGTYVSYAGTWLEPLNRFAYIEPVCTDPDYRRRGFARAAMFEGIRRCGELGADSAYVGSALPIYESMGFKKLFTRNCWTKCPERN